MTAVPARLAAPERRAAILEAAAGVFSSRSYGRATTAEIARAAGVSEPILYRHFPSKRALYVATLEHSWGRLREAWERAVAAAPGPEEHVPALAAAALERTGCNRFLANLWVQAVAEAGDDEEIRRYLRDHVRAVHDHVAGVMRAAQKAGGIHPARDPDAEAWAFLAVGLLATFGERLGGVLARRELDAVRAARREWLGAGVTPVRPG